MHVCITGCEYQLVVGCDPAIIQATAPGFCGQIDGGGGCAQLSRRLSFYWSLFIRSHPVDLLFLSFSTVNEESKVISQLIENCSGRHPKTKKVVQHPSYFFSVFCVPVLIVETP